MLKKTGLIFAAILLAGSTLVFGETLGKGLTLDKTTSISDILAAPDDFVGHTVQIKGMIVDVCSTRGCWMYLAGEKPFEKIRVKVTDGEIVFPLTARGKQAVVEGTMEKFVLTKEQVIAKKKHHAEETGETFDPAGVIEGETVYQLRGLGADIKGL